MKYTLILENLNCAHCAGKIEQAIAETDGYEKSTLPPRYSKSATASRTE